jgi:SAM-dependent methyltransferase
MPARQEMHGAMDEVCRVATNQKPMRRKDLGSQSSTMELARAFVCGTEHPENEQQLTRQSMSSGRLGSSHARLTTWGLTHAPIQSTDTILDVGCGGGRTIDTMAKAASQGRVFGVDYSATSVDVARRVNAAAIEAGRVDVQQASVSALPFAEATFDLVTAVETHYYWPDLRKDLQEIRRVLKPGGRALLIAETYRGGGADWLYRPVMRLLRADYRTIDEHRAALEGAGYTSVELHTEPSKGWLCAVGLR